MKISFYLRALILSFLLTGCSNDNADKSLNDVVADESNNFVKCTVSGDKGGKYKAEGKKVHIGFLRVENNVIDLFSVGFANLDGVSMSTGMFSLDLNSRSEQEGSIMAMFTYNNGNNWKDKFSSLNYPLFYDTNKDSRDSKTYLTLTKVEKLNGGYLHLAGIFRFNASNIPEQLPEECIMEAVQHSDRYPTYLGKLAGTSEIDVSGDFDIVVLAKLMDW